MRFARFCDVGSKTIDVVIRSAKGILTCSSDARPVRGQTGIAGDVSDTMCGHSQAKRLIGLATVAAVLAVPPLVTAQPPTSDEPPVELNPALLNRFSGLNEGTNRLDWEAEYPHLVRAIHNVWNRNGWTDEADRFALDAACEIASIPPWEPIKRLNRLNERVEERYGLAGESRTRFRKAVMRETARFLMRNAGDILEQTNEWMELRSRREPITADQVAEWMEESGSIMDGVTDSADRIFEELEPLLTPDKRRLLQRDMRNYEKRQKVVDEMADRWRKGQWKPEHWGMQDDPIQRSSTTDGRGKSAPPDAVPARSVPRVKQPGSVRPLAHDPSTWHAYVRQFKKRFELDAGQANTADSVHEELLDRANRYLRTHADTLDKVPRSDRDTHEAYEPIRSLYRELQERLAAIPTSSQRLQSDQ